MEDHIKKEAEDRTGLKWRKVRKRFKHPEVPYLVGHVDGLNKDSVLEVKCTKSMNRKDYGPDGAEFSHWEFGNVQMCPGTRQRVLQPALRYPVAHCAR